MHVDEIGLTSDKYVPLNRTLSSLALKVTIEPMSLQRWQLMQVSGLYMSLPRERFVIRKSDLFAHVFSIFEGKAWFDVFRIMFCPRLAVADHGRSSAATEG